MIKGKLRECIRLVPDNTIVFYQVGDALQCQGLQHGADGKVIDVPGTIMMNDGSDIFTVGRDSRFYQLEQVPIADQITTHLNAGEYQKAFDIADNESQLAGDVLDSFLQSPSFNAIFYVQALVKFRMRRRLFGTDRPDILDTFLDQKERVTSWVLPAAFVSKQISKVEDKAKLDDFLVGIEINGLTGDLIAAAVEHELFGFVKKVTEYNKFV
jgi:hypothetical protein